MVTKLNNFTKKSFSNYSNPTDLYFREKNIIFGNNGKGKSSCSVGIREEFLKITNKINQAVRLFDKDYISNYLLLENSNNKLKGIEANFGKDSVDIEKEIAILEKKIVSSEVIDNKQKSIDSLKASTRKHIDSIHDRKKGIANIQRKPKEESINRVIELYKKDYEDAKKIEGDDSKLLEINGDDVIEKQIVQLEILNKIPNASAQLYEVDRIRSIFSDNYNDKIEIPAFEIIEWIETGIVIHAEEDNCKFCGGKVDYFEIKSKVEKYKDNKKHKAIENLKIFEAHLEGLLQQLLNSKKESKNYTVNIGDSLKEDFEKLDAISTKIEAFIKICNSKIENIEIEKVFDFHVFLKSLKSIDQIVNRINNSVTMQLTDLRKKQNNLTSLVKGAIGLEIQQSILIKENTKEIINEENSLQNILKDNTKIQLEIQDLKEKKSLTKDFADFVTQILSDINISIKVSLDIDNKNYIIKNTNENLPLSLKDISEGEKNLLALLFFYFELFSDNKQIKIKENIELIIVDDPISSMDDSNKFYILELMKNLLELPNKQVFILTHSWDDFCNLSYGRKAWIDTINKQGEEINSKFATIEIIKENGKSKFSKVSNVQKPYKYLFKEIYEFSIKKNEDLKSECQIYHYPNVMRRVFEEWYSFKTGKDLNLTSTQQSHLASIFKITSTTEKTKLGSLLKICNILSHSINASKNPEEIHQSAKFLMKIIETNDSLHFNSMKV